MYPEILIEVTDDGIMVPPYYGDQNANEKRNPKSQNAKVSILRSKAMSELFKKDVLHILFWHRILASCAASW
jgi:hypothetical protein